MIFWHLEIRMLSQFLHPNKEMHEMETLLRHLDPAIKYGDQRAQNTRQVPGGK